MCPCDEKARTVCGHDRDRITTAAAQRDLARATHDFATTRQITAALSTYGWKTEVVLGTEAQPTGGQP